MNHQLNQIIWGWAGVLALTVTALWLLFRLRHLLVFHPFRLAADLLDSMKGRQGNCRCCQCTGTGGTRFSFLDHDQRSAGNGLEICGNDTGLCLSAS